MACILDGLLSVIGSDEKLKFLLGNKEFVDAISSIKTDDKSRPYYEKDTKVNHSGGAIGVDGLYGNVALAYGIKSNHFYRETTKNPPRDGNVAITDAEYAQGIIMVAKAAKLLGRKVIDKFLPLWARNWMQVKNADGVYAIAEIDGTYVDGDTYKAFKPKSDDDKVTIKGGTGWAVAMAEIEYANDGRPIYVFVPSKAQWFRKNFESGDYVLVDGIPKLEGNFAGIGTRDIESKFIEKGKYTNVVSSETTAAVKAVIDLFEEAYGVTNVNIPLFVNKAPIDGFVSIKGTTVGVIKGIPNTVKPFGEKLDAFKSKIDKVVSGETTNKVVSDFINKLANGSHIITLNSNFDYPYAQYLIEKAKEVSSTKTSSSDIKYTVKVDGKDYDFIMVARNDPRLGGNGAIAKSGGYIANDITIEDVVNHVKGTSDTPASKQKAIVTEFMSKVLNRDLVAEIQGMTLSEVVQFIAFHEVAHKLYDTGESYYSVKEQSIANSYGKGNPDIPLYMDSAILAEARANEFAFAQIGKAINGNIDTINKLLSDKSVINGNSSSAKTEKKGTVFETINSYTAIAINAKDFTAKDDIYYSKEASTNNKNDTKVALKNKFNRFKSTTREVYRSLKDNNGVYVPTDAQIFNSVDIEFRASLEGMAIDGTTDAELESYFGYYKGIDVATLSAKERMDLAKSEIERINKEHKDSLIQIFGKTSIDFMALDANDFYNRYWNEVGPHSSTVEGLGDMILSGNYVGRGDYKKLLGYIISNSDDEVAVEYAKAVLNIANTFKGNENLKVSRHLDTTGTEGAVYYDTNSNVISYVNPAHLDNPFTLIHEIVHGLSVKAINNMEFAIEMFPESNEAKIYADLFKDIDFILNDVKHTTNYVNISGIAEMYDRDAGGSFYGFTDRYEFLSEFMSNKFFREFLKNVYPDGTKVNIYNKIRLALAKLLGLSSGNVASMFDIIDSKVQVVFALNKSNTGEVLDKASGRTMAKALTKEDGSIITPKERAEKDLEEIKLKCGI